MKNKIMFKSITRIGLASKGLLIATTIGIFTPLKTLGIEKPSIPVTSRVADSALVRYSSTGSKATTDNKQFTEALENMRKWDEQFKGEKPDDPVKIHGIFNLNDQIYARKLEKFIKTIKPEKLLVLDIAAEALELVQQTKIWDKLKDRRRPDGWAKLGMEEIAELGKTVAAQVNSDNKWNNQEIEYIPTSEALFNDWPYNFGYWKICSTGNTDCMTVGLDPTDITSKDHAFSIYEYYFVRRKHASKISQDPLNIDKYRDLQKDLISFLRATYRFQQRANLKYKPLDIAFDFDGRWDSLISVLKAPCDQQPNLERCRKSYKRIKYWEQFERYLNNKEIVYPELIFNRLYFSNYCTSLRKFESEEKEEYAAQLPPGARSICESLDKTIVHAIDTYKYLKYPGKPNLPEYNQPVYGHL